MIRRCLTLLPLLAAVLCAADHATVRVEVWAGPANPLRDAKIELVERGTGRKIDAAFRDFVATKVPHGHYILRVSRPGFRNHEQRLAVLQDPVSLRVGMAVSNVPLCVLTGVVDPAKPDMWVKVIPILNQEFVVDAQVQEDGRFALSGLSFGESAVLLIQGRRVVSTLQIHACTDKSIQVTWAPPRAHARGRRFETVDGSDGPIFSGSKIEAGFRDYEAIGSSGSPKLFFGVYTTQVWPHSIPLPEFERTIAPPPNPPGTPGRNTVQ